MTPKIQKITAEIDKTRTRVDELRERLRELERQKTELENTEIVALFRSLEVSPDQLPAFIANMKAAALPQETAATPAHAPTPTTTTSGYMPETEEDDHED